VKRLPATDGLRFSSPSRRLTDDNRVHTVDRAFAAGYLAGNRGESITRCNYRDQRMIEAWEMGWRAGKR
jgi:ribosome modulation factor